jgi:endonuclease YncB( thermonuclease family)
MLMALVLASCMAQAESLPCPCYVVEVADGDTVFVQDQSRTSRKIWLAGIDAPELEQPYGEESRSNLLNLVLGQAVHVEYAKRDRYGRIIGTLLKDDQDINLLQIRQGLAWHFTTQDDELTRQDHAIYRSAEQHSRLRKVGLWSSDAPIPPWKHRANR